jgi:hypothetical protein
MEASVFQKRCLLHGFLGQFWAFQKGLTFATPRTKALGLQAASNYRDPLALGSPLAPIFAPY